MSETGLIQMPGIASIQFKAHVSHVPNAYLLLVTAAHRSRDHTSLP